MFLSCFSPARVKPYRDHNRGTVSFALLTAALLLVTTVLTTTGCGGGGSNQGGGGDNRSNAQSSSDPYGVRVMHAAIDAAPVDLISSLNPQSPLIVQEFFANRKDSSGYRSLPQEGEQTLTLTKHGASSESIASFNISAESSARYSILLYGDLQNFGLKTKLIRDELPAEGEATPYLRVINGVSGAAKINVASSSITPLELTTGQASSYLALNSLGEITITARRSSDGTSLGDATFKAEAGAAYTVLFAGEVGFYTKVLVYRDR
jgi:hypothetical protein